MIEGRLVLDDLDGHRLPIVLADALDDLAECALPQQVLHHIPAANSHLETDWVVTLSRLLGVMGRSCS